MSLRTRIALTFLILLTAVLVAALSAVSLANRANAERDVKRQLEFGAQTFSGLLKTNRRLLTQASQAVADDYGFREAVAEHDTETLISALENSGDSHRRRPGGAHVARTAKLSQHRAPIVQAGSQFPIAALKRNNGHDASATVMLDNGKHLSGGGRFRLTARCRWRGSRWVSRSMQRPRRSSADITKLGVILSPCKAAATGATSLAMSSQRTRRAPPTSSPGASTCRQRSDIHRGRRQSCRARMAEARANPSSGLTQDVLFLIRRRRVLVGFGTRLRFGWPATSPGRLLESDRRHRQDAGRKL